ncbi:hypothetical protein [Paenisporosarcina quisquiliarum]|uniref:hypothetical protein n=1 Tax=Paenisporosarcina quisquiliarum TaxID=365346 RepID=UPI003736B00B
MKKQILLIFIPLLILSGCLKEESYEETYQSHEQPMAEFEEVYTLGLYDGDTFEKERTFNIKDDSFTKSVVLGNKTSKNSSFILLIFDHGEQLEFSVSNGEPTINHSFEIMAGEYKELKVSFQDLDDGFHSITYVVLPNPEKLPDDYETAVSLADIFSIRVNLLKNIDNITDERPALYTDALISEDRKIHGVFLSSRENLYEALYKENMEGNNFSYNLIYGNSNSESLDFYIVGLLNFKQTLISGKNKYIYDNLKPGEEKSIPIEFKESLKERNNSLQFLMITTPFNPITQQKPFLLQDPLASNRMVLIK